VYCDGGECYFFVRFNSVDDDNKGTVNLVKKRTSSSDLDEESGSDLQVT